MGFRGGGCRRLLSFSHSSSGATLSSTIQLPRVRRARRLAKTHRLKPERKRMQSPIQTNGCALRGNMSPPWWSRLPVHRVSAGSRLDLRGSVAGGYPVEQKKASSSECHHDRSRHSILDFTQIRGKAGNQYGRSNLLAAEDSEMIGSVELAIPVLMPSLFNP
jgi:hypothetical protein